MVILFMTKKKKKRKENDDPIIVRFSNENQPQCTIPYVVYNIPVNNNSILQW